MQNTAIMGILNQFFDKRKRSNLNAISGLLLMTFITLIFSFTPHPYHVSFTEINYKKESQNLTFSVEVFTDDLEMAVKLDYKPEKFFLGTESLSDSTEILIQKYISSKTTVIIDGIVMKELNFLPSESNPDRTTVYFELTDLPNFKSFAFYNEVLVSTFPDQQNIVEFTHSGKKEKALFDKEKTSSTWIVK